MVVKPLSPTIGRPQHRESFIKRYLDPADRFCEVLFGLIMVLTSPAKPDHLYRQVLERVKHFKPDSTCLKKDAFCGAASFWLVFVSAVSGVIPGYHQALGRWWLRLYAAGDDDLETNYCLEPFFCSWSDLTLSSQYGSWRGWWHRRRERTRVSPPTFFQCQGGIKS